MLRAKWRALHLPARGEPPLPLSLSHREFRGLFDAQDPEAPPVLDLAGGGLFWFWKAGVLSFLQREYGADLLAARCLLRGHSSGALAAALAGCGVDLGTAAAHARELLQQAGVFSRPLGVLGVWGGIVRRALSELLPEDAAERASGRVRLRLTAWPSLRPLHVERFDSRDDLIDACLASGHLPLLLDGRWTARVQGLHVMDGAFSRWAERLLPHRPAGAELPERGLRHALQPPPPPAPQQQQQQELPHPAADLRRMVLDFSFDPALHPLPTFGAVRLQSVEQPGLLLQRGWEYGRRLQREGVWGAWLGLAPPHGRAWPATAC